MNATQKRKIEQLVRTRAKQKLMDLTETVIVQLNDIKPTTTPLPLGIQTLGEEHKKLTTESAAISKKLRQIEDKLYKKGWRYSRGNWMRRSGSTDREGGEFLDRILRSTRTELTKYGEPTKQTPEPIRQLHGHQAFHDGYARPFWPGLTAIVEGYVTKVDALNQFVEDTLLVQLYLEDAGEETLKGLMETLDSLLK